MLIEGPVLGSSTVQPRRATRFDESKADMGAVAQLPAGRAAQPAAVPLRSRGLATSLVRAPAQHSRPILQLHAVTGH